MITVTIVVMGLSLFVGWLLHAWWLVFVGAVILGIIEGVRRVVKRAFGPGDE
jgi:hypothetical protein